MKLRLVTFQFICYIFFSLNIQGQFRANYYPFLESNKGVANKNISYNLFSLTSSNASPADSVGFNTYVKAGTLQKNNSSSLASEKGTINTVSSTQYNALNWNSYTQLQTAIFAGVTPYSGFGDYFAFVVSGYFIPKETGIYTFTIEADDADELVINNKVVVAQYSGHGPSAVGTHTGTISLIAGIKYQFRARMQEYAGGEQLNVFWQKPSEINNGSWYQDIEELSSLNVINNGLVYKFDFNNQFTYPLAGTKVYDIVNGIAGTISGTIYKDTVKAMPNNSLYFVGNSNYVDFGTSPTNFPTGDITVSIWVNFQDLLNPWNIFMTKWFLGSGAGTTDFHYSVKNNGTNYYQNLYTTSNSDMYGTTIIGKYNWYCLGFTLTNAGTLQFYINGLPDGPAINNVSRTNNTTSNFLLGDARGNAGFNGYLSAVNVYNRALLASEMYSNFNSEKTRFNPIFSPTDASYWNASGVWDANGFNSPDQNNSALYHYTPWIDSQQGWSESNANYANLTDYIWIKLDQARYVNGIVTQGRANSAQWVTQGKVDYSLDGTTWYPISTYNMNTDQNTKVNNYFSSPVFAKYIKVTPTAYNSGGFPTLRLGLLY
jgi:hypothetical protein